MHIGRLAQQAGTTTRTVRYYEEMGLIQPEGRSPGGFRCYSEEQLFRLRMILSLKEMEFDLEHIKLILDKRHEKWKHLETRLETHPKRRPGPYDLCHT